MGLAGNGKLHGILGNIRLMTMAEVRDKLGTFFTILSFSHPFYNSNVCGYVKRNSESGSALERAVTRC